LANVVTARHASSGFPCGLNRRQQQAHENPDDRDDHQEFHEREAMDIPTLHEKTP
jgi:hypothetical protein